MKTSTIIWIVVGAFVVLAGIGITVYFLTKNQKQTAQDAALQSVLAQPLPQQGGLLGGLSGGSGGSGGGAGLASLLALI